VTAKVVDNETAAALLALSVLIDSSQWNIPLDCLCGQAIFKLKLSDHIKKHAQDQFPLPLIPKARSGSVLQLKAAAEDITTTLPGSIGYSRRKSNQQIICSSITGSKTN
jgi:hypothetical protein